MSRARERTTAAVILAAAVGVATWVLQEQHVPLAAPVPPKPPVQQVKAPEKEPTKPKPQSLAIELIDIASLAPPPPAPLPAPRQEAPAPTAAPRPMPVEAPVAPRLVPAEVIPPPPEPVKVLQPQTIERPAPPPAIKPLQVENTQPPKPTFAPLKPGDEKLTVKPPPRDTKVLLAAAAKMEREQSEPKPAFKALQPGDEKVTAKKPPPPPRPSPVPQVAPQPAKVTPPPRDTSKLIAAAARIEKAVEKSPPPRATPVAVSSEAIGEGRALLRILEQGSGPSIEIGWPDDERTRNRLYNSLKSCFGMRTGLLDGTGRLYLAEGARSQPTDINTDRYSGFVRRPEGAIAAEERGEIEHVRSYHAQRAASPARLFPRRVDAYLIGGLRQAVGENYLSLKSIRATYRLEGNHVVVDGIVADGREMDGVIDFSAVADCR